ncbi:uncharacterized protein LOC141728131 [Zonotrichia albicollis]|uniref:uncharacterized protein LOC141728131 n=1 Tax=Zonotrichia albicollis TaxID=44394 RepID=UPI003D80F934
MCVRGGDRIIPRHGDRRLPRLPASGAARASGAETCRAGAERGAWHTAPPPPPLTSASPPPPRSSWASLTGVKLIINRVKLIKGLGARWGRSESPSPSRALRIRLPAGSGPAAGTDRRRRAGAAPGQLSPSRKEKGGGDRGGGRRAAAAASPAGRLAATEIGRTGSGGGRRGLARGWLGSAQLGVCVRVCVCVCVCVQSRVPGAARGRCSAAQGQTPRPPCLSPAAISLCHGGSGEPQGTRPGQRTPQPPAPRSDPDKSGGLPPHPARKRAGGPGPALPGSPAPRAASPGAVPGRPSPGGLLRPRGSGPTSAGGSELAPRPPPRWARSLPVGAALLLGAPLGRLGVIVCLRCVSPPSK